MTRPSLDVLGAFGVKDADPLSLHGGQGEAWRAGNIVVKPTGDPAETAWRADVLDSLAESSEFRVTRPVRSADGSWMAGDWEAWHVVAEYQRVVSLVADMG